MIGKIVVTVLFCVALLGPCHHATGNVMPPEPAPVGGWMCAGYIAPPLVGPPAICHPIDIGDAQSLPWGGSGKFDVDSSYARNDLERLVGDTIGVLIRSDDPFVHMETIRRAVIYMTGIGHAKRKAGGADRMLHELVTDLRSRIVTEMVAETPDTEALALRWFDVGYLLAAYRQAGDLDKSGGGEEYLAKAVELMPENGAFRLGTALAMYGHGTNARTCYVHLGKAVALADEKHGALRVNLMNTFGRFLGADSYAELASKVEQRLERA